MVRMHQARKKYKDRLQYFKDHVSSNQTTYFTFIIIWSLTTQWSVFNVLPSIVSFQINDVVKIQAFIRANKARDDYKTLSKHFMYFLQILFHIFSLRTYHKIYEDNSFEGVYLLFLYTVEILKMLWN